MALLKSDIIQSITGKQGGNVFKRDASGQHVYAMPRIVRKKDTPKSRKVKYWYGGKKIEESYGPKNEPPFDWPKAKTTGIVFSLDSVNAHRQPSFTLPSHEEVELSGFYYDQIVTWINQNWGTFSIVPGITKELAILMTMKWFYVYKWTKGFSAAVSLIAAKTMMLDWASKAVAGAVWPGLALWLGLVGLQFYYKLTDWLEGKNAFITFNTGRVLIWQNDELYWGGLHARDTQEMFDFWKCKITDFGSCVWDIVPGATTYKYSVLRLEELYQTYDFGYIYHYIYTWQQIHCHFRGYCYTVGKNLMRLQCDPHQQEYWNKPIGWYQPVGEICEYLNQFKDHWVWPGHPADPL